MAENVTVAIIGVAGAGLAAWLGAIQIQVNQQSDDIQALKNANPVALERIQQCERLALQILQEEEDIDIGGERLARELFEQRGCNELRDAD